MNLKKFKEKMFYFWLKRKNIIFCVILALILFISICGYKMVYATTFTDNFTGTTYYDSANSSGTWYDSFYSGYAKLWGKFFTNMQSTIPTLTTAENVSNTASTPSYSSRMVLDSSGNPYVLWYETISTVNYAYFTKWSPTGCGGSGCWTQMDGTAGSYTFGSGTTSHEIAIDGSGNPYVLLNSTTSAKFAKWTVGAGPSVCGTGINDCWTNMKGTVSGLETAYTSSYASLYNCVMVLTSSYTPYISCFAGGTNYEVEFSKWTSTGCSGVGCWTKMNGTAGYDVLRTGNPGLATIVMRLDSSGNAYVVFSNGPTVGNSYYEVYYTKATLGGSWAAVTNLSNTTNFYSTLGDMQLDTSNNPYVTWSEGGTGNSETVFTHWNGSAWVTMSGTAGYENLSSTSTASTLPSLVLNSSNVPHIVWQENAGTGSYDIRFCKWTVGAGESVCGTGITDCWTGLDSGDSLPLYDNISGVLSYSSAAPIISLNSNVPYVFWREAGYGIMVRKWDSGSSSWKGLDGLASVTQATLHTTAANYTQALWYNNAPYLTDNNGNSSPKDVFFSKYYQYYHSLDTLQSLTFDSDASSIIQARLTIAQTLNGGDVSYQVSNNGGTTWCGDDSCSGDYVTASEISAGQNTVNFSAQASDLRWRAVLTTSDTTATPLIDYVTIDTTTGTTAVTAPNTGVTWNYGVSNTITWSNTGTSGSNVKIDISRDGGSSWATILASTPNDGTQAWTVTAPATTQARIRVTDLTYPAKNDMSDVNFTINAPTISVTAPNTAVTWYAGESQNITWTNAGTITNVKLEYSKDNFVSDIHVIESSITNNGTYPWAVANDPSTTVKIRVSNAADSEINDVSDTNFTISNPVITVTAPNGGQTWYIGEIKSVTWDTLGTIANVNIVYSKDNFANQTSVAGPIANTGTYPWTIPADATSTMKVKVSSASDSNIYDVSNDYTDISYSTITLTAPNGGESLATGDIEYVTWSVTGAIANVKIEYSTDDFASSTVIIASTPNDGQYEWEVPNLESESVKLRVSDAAGPSINDVSNGNFGVSLTGVYLEWEIEPVLVFNILDNTGAVTDVNCNLGILVPNEVSYCQYRIGVGTNYAKGFSVTIQDSESAQGLRSSSEQKISDVTDNLVDSGEEAGIQIVSLPNGVSAGSGFPSGQDKPVPYESAETFLYSNAPASYLQDEDYSDTAVVRYSVVITSITPAGNYSQAIRYTATSNY